MTRQPLVEVLLATYNGERFLREQIDSIFAQDYSPLRIVACDDGSTDGTSSILSEYATLYPDKFHILAGPPTGNPKRNFLRLLQSATAGYACFADQDDVWMKEKISLSMQAMLLLEDTRGVERPALVFTDLTVVDERLQTWIASMWRHNRSGPERASDLALLLGQNIVTGCTALLNRPLIELACRMPDEAEMHDHWVALLAASFGSSLGLEKQTVLYRQHDRNVLGAGLKEAESGDQMDIWKQRRERSEQQAAALLRIHGSGMQPEKRRLVEAYIDAGTNPNRVQRVTSILRHRFYVLGIRHNIAMLWFLWTKDSTRKTTQ